MATSSQTPIQTIGIDVSDRYTSFCVLDVEGDIQEEGKVRTTPEAFSRRFASIHESRVVLEVGTHSRWASQLLSSFGHEVIVANPWKVKLIAASIRRPTGLTPRPWHDSVASIPSY